MDLGLTQPLTEMSTSNISRAKGGQCVGLTTLPPSYADCLEIWEPQPSETLRACLGPQWDCYIQYMGDRGNTVVKVLCYKSEGRWFDPS